MKTKLWFTVIMIFVGLSLQAQEAKNKMYDPDKNQEMNRIYSVCSHKTALIANHKKNLRTQPLLHLPLNLFF